MTIRIVPILVVAIMIGPSLAYGAPACMTESGARAKFPKAHLIWLGTNHCWTFGAVPVHSRRTVLAAEPVPSPRPEPAASPCLPHDPYSRRSPCLPHDPYSRQSPCLLHDLHRRQSLPQDPSSATTSQQCNVDIRHVNS